MTSEHVGRLVAGSYRLVSRLAVGGMGVTYRAWDLRRSCPVVLKMPRRPAHDPDGEEYARLAARFVREIEAMRALAHDYIVPIVDHGIDEGTPFVAMRFLPGGSLSEDRKAAAGGEWQPVAAGLLHFWLPSIAGALDFMHSKGVVHRDVKPANIFFDGFRNPFLGDFGIAKVVGDDGWLEKGQTLTATHMAIGTPEYMAPEMLSPKSVPDGRADQYALAISVYELLSGRRPFTGSTAHIVVEHATLPAPPLDTRSLGIPRSLAAAVERALSKRPGERFGSCREFAEAALAGVTPEPNDPSVVRLVCPGCRKVLRVPAAAGGRRGNCPSCREVVEIAEDFSALWLRSEAALVAESSPESGPVPVLGLFGEAGEGAGPDRGVREPQTESAERVSENVPVGRGWSGSALVATAGVAALIAALLGGLATHLVWLGHHGQTMQDQAAERERERATHAQALTAAETAKAAAVVAAEAEWRARFAAEQAAWEEELAAAEQSGRESEERLAAIDREAKQAEAARIEAARIEAARIEAAKPKPFSELTNSIGIKMVLIPAGTFTMGDDQDGPAHQVMLTKPYYLGVTEVTNAQWRTVMGDDRGDAADAELPTGVDWDDAVTYCSLLSARAEERRWRRFYRLPTEAEWEYACRAGTTTAYSFGDDVSRMGDFAWFAGNAGGRKNGSRGPRPVGQKKPNPWGLYDMHGNVWEWVSDGYEDYPTEAVQDPIGPSRRNRHWYPVFRGGSWNGSPVESLADCRSARRNRGLPSARNDYLGFRLALSPSEDPATEAESQAGERRRGGSEAETATERAAAEPEPKPVELPTLTNSIGIKMVLIPAGTFTMGDELDGPAHEVTLTKPFYLGVTEVTNAQWRTVMGDDRGDAADAELPVDVDWKSAVEYCRRLSARAEERAANRDYRLPTEAEWEYACRAGTTTKYSFGDDERQLVDFAWFDWNSGERSHPVGQKKPNAWGLYDMHGNVWEWVSDWYGEYPSEAVKDLIQSDPTGSAKGSFRVFRGGCWHRSAGSCRSAVRGRSYPRYRINSRGFRLALSPSAEPELETEGK